METYKLNTGRDWHELQETNGHFIVLDSKDQVVSCNDRAKKSPLPATSFSPLPLDCFWLDAEQRIFALSEFKNIVGKEVLLLFSPNEYDTHRVKVLVESFQLFDQQFYSLFIQNISASQNLADTHPQMALALMHAIKKNQLTLNYQPQVNVLDNSLYGVEALARWTSEEFGVITPDHFVAVAEEFGVIVELDLWVLRKACEQFVLWQKNGIPISRIAVNFSPLSFECPLIANEIRLILNITGMSASHLVIELTENKRVTSPDVSLKVIEELHLMGVNISLDDFGAGYSNLKRLLKLPVSQLKLDRAFVAELPNRFSKELSETVLSISEKMGAVAIAEGVETQDQLDYLLGMGYQIVQGYFFSPPLPMERVEAWLIGKNSAS